MAQYIEIDPNGFAAGLYDDCEAPPAGPAGYAYYLMDPPMSSIPDGPTPSQRLKWMGEGLPLEWRETATLEQVKERKNAEIDRSREEANATYFDFQGQRIACDDMSWKDIMSTNGEIALTQTMPAGWVGGWKSKDKNPDGSAIFVSITDVATWITFIQAMVNRGLAHFGKSQNLKAQLAAAATPAEVDAIQW